MAITPLSQDTVRLLRSHLTLSSALAVVKELVENSIDAKATIIGVLISADTVGKIEVRDNGHGISPQDFNAFGRRGHTSKLRSYQDLRSLGGSSLGFRGEAVAAICTVGKVMVTTRTLDDKVATFFHVQTDGEGRDNVSTKGGPVGTTVSVTGLFARFPVREKVATKESASTLAKINNLLTTYALARPHLRLTVRVLGRPDSGWSYSPRPGASLARACVDLFGPDLASQCIKKSRRVPSARNDEADTRNGGEDQGEWFEIETFIPRPDAVPSKISKGIFITVDSRPVSTSRGTFKKIISEFRNHIGRALGKGEQKLTDPFIALNIRCSPGSYDVNFDPQKNDVMFTNEPALLRVCNALFGEVYLVAEGQDAHHDIVPQSGAASADEEPRKPHERSLPVPVSCGDTAVSTVPARARPDLPRPFVIASTLLNMTSTVEDETPATNQSPTRNVLGPRELSELPDVRFQPPRDDASDVRHGKLIVQPAGGESSPTPQPRPRSVWDMELPREISSSTETVNPWVIAKRNANRRQQANTAQPITSLPISSLRRVNEAPHPIDSRASRDQRTSTEDMPIPGPVLRDLDLSHPSPLREPEQVAARPTAQSGRLPQVRGAVMGRFQRETPRRPVTGAPDSGLQTPPHSSVSDQPRGVLRTSARRGPRRTGGVLRQSTLPSWNRNASTRQRPQGGDNLQDAKLLGFDPFPQIEPRGDSTAPEVFQERFEAEPFRRLMMSSSPFQSQPRVGPSGAERLSPTPQSQSRQAQENVPSGSELPQEDPRYFPMQRQRSLAASRGRRRLSGKLHRLKSSLLPLETRTNETLGLVKIEHASLRRLQFLETRLSVLDDAIPAGGMKEGLLTIGDADRVVLNAEIERLVRQRWNGDCSVEFHPRVALASHSPSSP